MKILSYYFHYTSWPFSLICIEMDWAWYCWFQFAYLPDMVDASKDDVNHDSLIGGHKKACKLCYLSIDFDINRFNVSIIFVFTWFICPWLFSLDFRLYNLDKNVFSVFFCEIFNFTKKPCVGFVLFKSYMNSYASIFFLFITSFKFYPSEWQ